MQCMSDRLPRTVRLRPGHGWSGDRLRILRDRVIGAVCLILVLALLLALFRRLEA